MTPQYLRLEVGQDGPVLRRGLWLVEQPSPCVIVAPILEGICRSDLKELAGGRALRRDFGHEFVARVVKGDAGFTAGERVVLDPHVAIARSSGFGDYVFACGDSERLRRAFRKVPDGIANEAAVFVEPLACAIHCVSRFRAAVVEARGAISHVAIIGAGLFGCLIALLLQDDYSVRLFNRSSTVVQALEALQLFERGSVSGLHRLGAPVFDAAIVTTSDLDLTTLHSALACTRPSGLVVLFAGTAPEQALGPGLPDLDLIRRRELRVDWAGSGGLKTFVGTHGASPADFDAALASCGMVPFQKLISRRIAFKDLDRTLREMLGPAPRVPGRTVVQFPHAAEA